MRIFAASAPRVTRSFELAVACWRAINKAKSDAAVSMGREVESLLIAANGKTHAELEPVLADVLGAGRCRSHRIRCFDSLEDGVFLIEDAVFAEREAE